MEESPPQGPDFNKLLHALNEYLNHMHVHPIHLQPFGLIQIVYLSLCWCLAPATPANKQGKTKCTEKCNKPSCCTSAVDYSLSRLQ